MSSFSRSNNLPISYVVFFALTFLGTLTGLSAQPILDAEAQLPLSRVILYTSGVAYFEHSGTISGDASLRFQFSTNQINDVLKSLVLRDLDGGSIETVNYPSQDPIERALGGFLIDLSGNPSLRIMLEQLKGFELQINAPELITGKVLSLEERTVPGRPNEQNYNETFVNLLTNSGFRSIPISEISTIRAVDAKVNVELERALEVLRSKGDKELKTVIVKFFGKGSRRILISYLAEAPLWKASYRLDLSELAKTGPKAQAFLQAWAIVENTSDSDWKSVKLSLISGNPISFTQDLYTPQYVARPQIEISRGPTVRPQRYDQGIASRTAPAASRSSGYASPESALMAGEAAKEYPGLDAFDERANLADTGVQSQANAKAAGELFSFVIKNAVDVPRRSSAMLAFHVGSIDAEKVSIYNQSVLAGSPLNAVRLRNSTGVKLPPGPVTIFDGGMYGGDALLDTLGTKQVRLISYAVNGELKVIPELSSGQSITKFSINRGVLSVQRNYDYTSNYRLDNSSSEPSTLIIEHPKTSGRSLIDIKAQEETASHYRFELTIKGLEAKDYLVKERQVVSETIALLRSTGTSYLHYTSNAAMQQSIKDALAQAAKLRQNLDDKQSTIATLRRQRTALEADQTRYRNNLTAAGNNSVQGKQYLERLSESEKSIDNLDKQVIAEEQLLQSANKSYENFLSTLTL